MPHDSRPDLERGAVQDWGICGVGVLPSQVPRKGETLYLDIPVEEAHVFSTADGRRVSGDLASIGHL